MKRAKSDKKTPHGKVTKPLKGKKSQTSPKNDNDKKGLFLRLFGLGKATTSTVETKSDSKKSKKPQVHKSGQMGGATSQADYRTDNKRFIFIWCLVAMMFTTLIARAFYLQVYNTAFYQEKGDKFLIGVRHQPAYRGIISDRNQQPLAISAPLVTIVFNPYEYAEHYYQVYKKYQELKKIKDKSAKQTAKQDQLKQQLDNLNLQKLAVATHYPLDQLKKATGIRQGIDLTDPEAIKKALPSGVGSRHLPLLKDVSPEVANAVMALNFHGISSQQTFKRYYPQPIPNAALIGYMSQTQDDTVYRGQAGIEQKFQNELAGQDGSLMVLKDGKSNRLQEIKQITPEVAGKDVQLTIDARLQYLLYRELEKLGRQQKALWATGMVVEVNTGEVLAMTNWPSFNPNNLTSKDIAIQGNRAVQDVFEPGSVMKPFTIAAALESKRYSVNSLIDTNPGYILVNRHRINDHGNLGVISLATLLKKSSNVATTKIALSLPADSISNMQRAFGFGKITHMALSSEQAGKIITPKEKQIDRRATVSYGYGLEVTLAQLIQAYATLGSDGVMHPLTIIKSDAPNPPAKQVISKANANAIVKMMETVTEEGGTGTAAAIDGYRVAGKTGTARRADPEGGYYKDQYRNLFVGLAPASNPRLAVAILVESPREDHYAGQTAAPVFHNVMKEALRLYNVPLDKPLNAN